MAITGIRLDHDTKTIILKRRSYGTRLLRAAANGEDPDTVLRDGEISFTMSNRYAYIKTTADIPSEITDDAASALSADIDRIILDSLTGTSY